MKVLAQAVLCVFSLTGAFSLVAQRPGEVVVFATGAGLQTVQIRQPADEFQQSLPANAAHAPDPDRGVPGLYIPLLAGQPFSARVQVEFTRQLPDGTSIAEKYYAQEARDGAGRVYRESRDAVPADSDREPPLLWTILYDPLDSLIDTCYPERRMCRQMQLASPPAVEEPGPSPDGMSVLTRENLGTKTIDGLTAVGTRDTRSFKPGAFGNDKPIDVVKEFWYSPRLQVNLLVTRIDPRRGTEKLEFTDLKLGEPGAEWFALPEGYQVAAERTVTPRSMYPAELEPLIEKQVTGMTPEQLRAALGPVEAAIDAYAKAHAEASPDDRNDEFAGRVRSQLSMSLRVLQQNNAPQRVQQFASADKLLNETYQQVVTSACINKPAPGDPPNMPKDEASLRAEERAWVALRDAWLGFLGKLFPNADPQSFGWLITNERDNDLRRMLNVERNRGCAPEESIEPLLANLVTGMSAAQLAAAVKPVDAAIDAYTKAHAESAPNDRGEMFAGMVRMNLVQDLRMQQQGQLPTQDEFEDADLHLNQVWRAVIASPCLSRPIPADPPDAPVSEDKLRAEERAWIAVRDAWTAFMTRLYPNAAHAGFGTMLTEQRTEQLRQIQAVERNRGCGAGEEQ